MSNALTNVNLAKLAQESLPAAVETFAPLNAFTTDFSTAIATSGESIGTRYVDSLVGSDMVAGYAAAAEDVTYNAVTIPLDTWKGFTIGFTDLERSKAEFNLFDDFMVPGLEITGTLMMNTVWDLVTAANFAANTVVTAANYDRDIVADLGRRLDRTKEHPDRSLDCPKHRILHFHREVTEQRGVPRSDRRKSRSNRTARCKV